MALLADQRRKFMSGGALCVRTVLNALLEIREASLDVIDAITRYRDIPQNNGGFGWGRLRFLHRPERGRPR